MQEYKGYRAELQELFEMEKQNTRLHSYISRRKNYIISKLAGFYKELEPESTTTGQKSITVVGEEQDHA